MSLYALPAPKNNALSLPFVPSAAQRAPGFSHPFGANPLGLPSPHCVLRADLRVSGFSISKTCFRVSDFENGFRFAFSLKRYFIAKMKRYDLEERTVEFAVGIIEAVRKVSFDSATFTIKGQLVRAATSIGANYREANRAVSKRDFLHKVAIAEKESNESAYWLAILTRLFPKHHPNFAPLLKECDELLAILITISKNTKRGGEGPDSPNT